MKKDPTDLRKPIDLNTALFSKDLYYKDFLLEVLVCSLFNT